MYFTQFLIFFILKYYILHTKLNFFWYYSLIIKSWRKNFNDIFFLINQQYVDLTPNYEKWMILEKYLIWCFHSMAFSRTVIEFFLHRLDLLIRDMVEFSLFSGIAIRSVQFVFIEPSFPWGIRFFLTHLLVKSVDFLRTWTFVFLLKRSKNSHYKTDKQNLYSSRTSCQLYLQTQSP